jgi:phytoene synthase
VSRRNTSFYYSFLVLPPPQREALVAIWDFCRAVDDAVDEVDTGATTPALATPATSPPTAAAERERCAIEASGRALAGWRRELVACFEGGEPETAEGRRLVPCIARFNLPRERFEAVIDGVEMDLRQRRYDTFEALREYCLRVASAVGLICIEVFGYRDPATRQYAMDLGIALQLTNIIRDVASDLARDRVYLPQDDLARFGCTEDDLRAGEVNERVRALLAFECERAREHYRRARAELPRQDRRRLVAARIMGAIYFDVLQRIERAGYDVFSGVVRAPGPVRAAIAATTWLRTFVGG